MFLYILEHPFAKEDQYLTHFFWNIKIVPGLKIWPCKLAILLNWSVTIEEKKPNKHNSSVASWLELLHFFHLWLVHLYMCIVGLCKCVGLATVHDSSWTVLCEYSVCLCGFDSGTSSVPFFLTFLLPTS